MAEVPEALPNALRMTFSSIEIMSSLKPPN